MEKNRSNKNNKIIKNKSNAEKKEGITISRILKNKVFIVLVTLFVIIAVYNFFTVKNIIVTGSEKISSEDIIEKSGIKFGKSIFFAIPDDFEEKFEDEVCIERITAETELPSTISIVVTERKAIAFISDANMQVLVDKGGNVLEIRQFGNAQENEHLIEIIGMGSSDYRVNTQIGKVNELKFASFTELMSTLENNSMMERVKSIDMSNPLSIKMELESGYKVVVGDRYDIEDKISELKTIEEQFIAEGEYVGGTIDVSVVEFPVYAKDVEPTSEPTDEP